MKISRSRFFKVTKLCLLGSLALEGVFFVTPDAKADGYAECNQILAQDIFNRVIKSDSNASASASEAKASFYSQKDTEAFEAYKNARSEANKHGAKIDTEFHYGIIGGELGIDVNSEHQETFEEFSQKFNSAKDKYSNSSESKTSSSQNLVNNYASYVRDPGTVSAWKDCVTKTKETNLYAFASRDQAGKTYVNVIWVPGALAGTLPSIPISFVTDDEAGGVNIHAKPEEQVAMGSGRNFAVSCGTKCDNGFQVIVNGTLKNAAGAATNSFTSSVDVPPLKLPEPPPPVPTEAQEMMNILATKGKVIANADPLAVELRNRETGSSQRGFDIGMAAAEGQTLPGPGKQKIHDELSLAEQIGFSKAVDFSLERNNYFELAAKGAYIAKTDPKVAEARTINPSVFYWLGFDIATGIFGDPALGAKGNTLTGSGSLKIRDSLSVDGQRGFDASVKLHLGPPPLPRRGS